MPVPYGTSRQSGQLDRTTLLPLAAAGAGLLAYLLAFLDPQGALIFSGVPGFSIITAAVAIGLRMLPKAPNTLYAAVPLAAAGALVLLQLVFRGGVGGLMVVIMVLALLQLGAVVGALLLEAGVVGTASANQPRPAPPPPRQQGNPGQFRPPQGGWSPPGPVKPGPFPPPGGHHAPSPGGPGMQGAPVFPPPSGPPQGGWSPAQPPGPASPPSGNPSGQPSGGLSGTLPPPSSQHESSSSSGGPQATQHLPQPAPPDES